MKEKKTFKPILCKKGTEQYVGFENIKTGEFKNVMQIRNNKDLDLFIDIFDISAICIRNIS